jgi:trans-aconitate methyltransferase
MLRGAREYLSPRYRQVGFAQADGSALPVAGVADAVFSTATFHWVHDHAALFGSLFGALRPGGVVVAQCGGGPNIKRVHDRCDVLMRKAPFAPWFADWREPWHFADAEATAARLREAGFVDVQTTLEPSPVMQPDASAYRDFVGHVICRHHLARLPDAGLQEQFMDALTAQAAGDPVPFELDYWRLNLAGRKPA